MLKGILEMVPQASFFERLESIGVRGALGGLERRART